MAIRPDLVDREALSAFCEAHGDYGLYATLRGAVLQGHGEQASSVLATATAHPLLGYLPWL